MTPTPRVDNRPTLADYRSLRFAVTGPMATQVFSQRIGALLAYWSMRAGLSPSAVTVIALLASLSGSVAFGATGTTAGTVCALLLYQLGYALDCADGQLARATRSTSEFGAWLDVACDHVRNVGIAFAVSWFLHLQGTLPANAIHISIGVALAGMTVSLHTSTHLRRFIAGRAETRHPDLRWVAPVATLAIDTPVFLLLLCALRFEPPLLLAYMFVMGSLYIALSGYLGWRRLPRPS